jgi:hypothetical protein
MQREYQGVIFTKHALDRAQSRSISQADVVQVLKYPQTTQETEKPGATKFIKTLRDRSIYVVATFLPDKNQWLVVSVWVRGEEDQPPLSWQLITLPFRLLWSCFKVLWSLLKKRT